MDMIVFYDRKRKKELLSKVSKFYESDKQDNEPFRIVLICTTCLVLHFKIHYNCTQFKLHFKTQLNLLTTKDVPFIANKLFDVLFRLSQDYLTRNCFKVI